MDLPTSDVVQFFLELPSDSELDSYLQKEPRSEDWTDSGHSNTSSPHLTPSDNIMLDQEFWTNSPACQLLRQHVLTQSEPKPVAAQKEVLLRDWIDDIFLESEQHTVLLPSKTLPSDDSITEPESDDHEQHTVPSKTLPSDDSITEPESDDPIQHIVPSKTLTSDDSITEPESDDPIQHIVPSKTLTSDDSITEPESDDHEQLTVVLPTPKPITPKLDRKWFTTPSPPPPDSMYWKYFTQEEEARFYDRSRTDKSFQAVRELKRQLQLSLDEELRK
ncbi:hypothetical protein F4604DRAFT_1921162 [Suillus subluteus]|nr:hypothetical protein F4604DRAFT_1935177 [Suillus subluteus]KAG1882596.1 hypothetical protein F4604DRAFT_1921162 [Suillus subluteus]